MGILCNTFGFTGGVISLVGGGGKTSFMFALASELASSGETVITTTTTKIFPPAKEQSETVITAAGEEEILKALEARPPHARHVTLAKEFIPGLGKLNGYDPGVIDRLRKTSGFGWIIVEADGAKQRPFKAPATHEPVVPSASRWVVAVIGLDAVGNPLNEDWAHRPELVARLTGLNVGDDITSESVADVLLHPSGMFRNSPAEARKLVFLNKGEELGRQKAGLEIRAALKNKGKGLIDKIVVGSLRPEIIIFDCVSL